MIEKVRDFITEEQMIHRGDRIVAGISGGADSVCLFHVLRMLQPELGFSFSVLHVNHGIRGLEAERDAGFVEDLCRVYGILCRVCTIDVPALAKAGGLSEEEAGRNARRQLIFEEMNATGACRAAFAHQKNDVAETVLLNEARGTGLEGLASLRPVRDGIIRPLLCVTRGEIEAWLLEHQYSYCTDSTNLLKNYRRNRVRLDVLPVLAEEVNEKTAEHLADLAFDAGDAAEFLLAEADKRIRLYTQKEDSGGHCISIRLQQELFAKEARMMQAMVLRQSVKALARTGKDLSRKHIGALLGLAGRESGKYICLPYGLRALKTPDGMLLFEGTDGEPRSLSSVSLQIPGRTEFDGWLFSVTVEDWYPDPVPRKKYTKWFDYDKIKSTLVLRKRRQGDFLTIHPDGRRKSLSDYLTDAKLPKEERDRLVLLASEKEILWAAGLRTGESCRMDQNTKRVLRIEAFPAEDRCSYQEQEEQRNE